jgi:hydrogenase/urease accessory protein HupE
MHRSFHPGVPVFWLTLTALTLSLLSPMTAHAHTETSAVTGFLSGLQHPLSGWDHILAMIAVGLWGAQLGAPAVWALPVAFPMAMAFGGMIGLMGFPLPGVEIGIAISALVFGGMVSTECGPPLWVAAMIVGVAQLSNPGVVKIMKCTSSDPCPVMHRHDARSPGGLSAPQRPDKPSVRRHMPQCIMP